MTRIADLGEDILVQVLSFCNVHTVLVVSEVDQCLRTIAMVKQVWLRLIRHLETLSLMELPPNALLETLTTPELIDLVKRIVSGPRTWARGCLTAPKVRHRVLLTPEPGVESGGSPFPVKLLAACRLVAVRGPLLFEIWDISTGRRLWSRGCRVTNVGAQLCDNGRKLTLGIICRDPHWPTAEMMHIDLRTGASEPIVTIPLDKSPEDPSFSGDFAALVLGLGRILLVHLRPEPTAVVLEFPTPPQIYAARLIPGYLLIATTDRMPSIIQMYPLRGFSHLFKPMAELTLTSPIHVPNVGRVSIQIPHRALADPMIHMLPQLRMFIHRSPLNDDAYQISVHHSSGNPNGSAFIRYFCTIPGTPGAAAQWERISEVPAPLHRGDLGLTYSGYVLEGLTRDVHHSLRIPFEQSPPPLLGGRGCLARDVSGYGCVVATLTHDALLIDYYE
ncbi:hypothetical protein B0H17DRAFT_1340088, partial [Mycena rosella]